MKNTYYALSTENAAACGWSVIGVGLSRVEAEAEAAKLLPRGNDLRADTWRKNLTIMSRSAAIRAGMIDREEWPIWDPETERYEMER